MPAPTSPAAISPSPIGPAAVVAPCATLLVMVFALLPTERALSKRFNPPDTPRPTPPPAKINGTVSAIKFVICPGFSNRKEPAAPPWLITKSDTYFIFSEVDAFSG